MNASASFWVVLFPCPISAYRCSGLCHASSNFDAEATLILSGLRFLDRVNRVKSIELLLETMAQVSIPLRYIINPLVFLVDQFGLCVRCLGVLLVGSSVVFFVWYSSLAIDCGFKCWCGLQTLWPWASGFGV